MPFDKRDYLPPPIHRHRPLFTCQGRSWSIEFEALNDAPKVFLSHASEDKERFVLKFAEKLRAHGVDAWLDKWEMLPGHSLVDKIFEEGIKNAQAVIVILSKNSVEKPWVREELNAAMVRRINGLSKLIPVVIDDCQVPECLKSTVWEKITNLSDFDGSLDRILMAICGTSAKPPVGEGPQYARHVSLAIPGFTAADNAVFGSLCNLCVKKDKDWIDNQSLLKIAELIELHEEVFCESLDILAGQGLVELKKTDSGHIMQARPTVFGFDQFLLHTRKDYEHLVRTVALLVVNEKKKHGGELAKCAQFSELIVNHVVRLFEAKDWIKTSRYNGPTPCSFMITRVGPELSRWLRGD